MAKTTDPDVFIVKPAWVAKVINKPSVWYLKSLSLRDREYLTHHGATVSHTTQAGRTFTVVAGDDVSDDRRKTRKGAVIGGSTMVCVWNLSPNMERTNRV
jgi:hypothetical protein